MSDSEQSGGVSGDDHQLAHPDIKPVDLDDEGSDVVHSEEDEEHDRMVKASYNKDAGATLANLLAQASGSDDDEADARVLSKAARKPKVVDPEKAKRRMLKRRKLEKRELWDRDHVKPQFGPLEKKLRRIATRGVVTLFNAVAKQKKDDKRREEEEAGLGKKSGSEALSRMGFLQLLKASKDGKGPGAPEANAASEAGEGVIKAGETPSEEAGWNILKSDYMMNPKLKDWDREVDSSDDE